MSALARGSLVLRATDIYRPSSEKCTDRDQRIAVSAYLVLALLLIALPVLRDPTTFHIGLTADPSQMMWFLVWWPHALLHGLNPFISRVVWAPTGANLTWTTSIPAIALVMAPATWLLGPVVSYNIAAVLGPVITAWAAFLLCRWLTSSFVAGIVGGVVYGFSPYELGHILGGHLCFTVNFVPPLCLLIFGRLLEQSVRRERFVVTFATLLVLQCLISSEVFATMTGLGAIAWFSAYALSPAHRNKLRLTLLPITAAYFMATIILSPFLYFALANGAMPRQPLFPPTLFSADLLEFIFPTPLLLVARHSYEALASRNFGNLQENEFYLGLPLLVLLVRLVWYRWSEPLVRILVIMLGVVMVISVGPVLHVADRSRCGLPWAGLFKVPLLNQVLPVRLANYGFLIASLAIALSLAQPRLGLTRVLVAYVLVSYLPNFSLFMWPERYDNPAFFATRLYRKVLYRGENVVIFPYGVSGPSMLWQAETEMYFSMSGAWMGPTPQEFQRWPVVSAALTGLPLVAAGHQLSSFLATHHVEAVIAADGADMLPVSLEIKPLKLGGVSIYRLPKLGKRNVADQALDQLETFALQTWLRNLLTATVQFLHSGNELNTLSPAHLHELGYLPEARWARRLDLVLGGATHGAIAPIWIGPGPKHSIAIGAFASPTAAATLIASYAAEASDIYYPYPARFNGDLPNNHRVSFLLLTINPSFAQRGSRLARLVTK
jgi:hypothetical protein